MTDRLNVLGGEIRRLRLESNMTQRGLVAKLQAAGWDLNFDTLCQIEGGSRTLTDVEFVLILRLLNRQWTDVKPPRVKYSELDDRKK